MNIFSIPGLKKIFSLLSEATQFFFLLIKSISFKCAFRQGYLVKRYGMNILPSMEQQLNTTYFFCIHNVVDSNKCS